MAIIGKERKVGPITILELGERLTMEGVGELYEKVQSLLDSGHQELLLDCSRVIAIDSWGVGALVRNWTAVQRRGGKLKLLHLRPLMRGTLEVTGLLKVIEWFDEPGLALRSF